MSSRPPGEFFGTRPPPRILIINAPEDQTESLKDGLQYVPTLEFITSDELSRYRLADWDAAICFGGRPALQWMPHRFHVIVVGGESVGEVTAGDSQLWVKAARVSYARELVAPVDLPKEIQDLTRRDLVPNLLSGENWVLYSQNVGTARVVATSENVKAFVHDPDGLVLAGALSDRKSSSETWYLPAAADVPRWLRCALSVWATEDPASFKIGEDWQSAARWMTRTELEVRTATRQAESDFEAARQRHQAEQSRREAEFAAAAARADAAERRLLTVQDSELVDAVKESLTLFGFDVEDIDASKGPKGVKLEDLRVSDDADFVALVEVRGYTGGAKTSDLLRIEQFASRYALEVGREPAALWYIVNQFLQRDPSTRDLPLSSRPEEVDVFSASNGAIIDTRAIYDMTVDVQVGALLPSDARSLLIAARGVFQYSPSRPI